MTHSITYLSKKRIFAQEKRLWCRNNTHVSGFWDFLKVILYIRGVKMPASGLFRFSAIFFHFYGYLLEKTV